MFFEAHAPELDDLGRIIDFGVLKARLGSWIDEHWDHGFVLWGNDEEGVAAVSQVENQKIYLTPDNPTAENMAQHLLSAIAPKQLNGTGVQVVKVTLWETENCYAVATL